MGQSGVTAKVLCPLPVGLPTSDWIWQIMVTVLQALGLEG